MDERAHILVVDDEADVRFVLSEELTGAGYKTLTAASGEEALAVLQEEPVDVVLLDLKMAGMDGLRAMEEIVKQPLPPAIIVLTAHASLDSAIDTLRLGGCDYLRKPCRTEELLASVEKGLAGRRQAMRRQNMLHLIEETARGLRAYAPPQTVEDDTSRSRFMFIDIQAGCILLDTVQETASQDGEPFPLTPAEFRLLVCLLENGGQVVGYNELAAALHGNQAEFEPAEARQAVSTHLWRLRRKLGQTPDGGAYVVNVRGRGYRFVGNSVKRHP
jgi:DNA-binding response OmpR family regulator